MSDEVSSKADYDWMVADRNAWQAVATKATADRDAAQADLKQAEENNRGLMIEVQNMRAGLVFAAEERDNWQQRAELAEHEKQQTADAERRAWLNFDCASRLQVERDAAEEKCRKLHAENEGLRADALAYPPQRLDLQQYVTLKADYDRQVIMIETLREGLKRTESLLAKAQSQHIDDRLKGFLSVISQLADQAQDLLP